MKIQLQKGGFLDLVLWRTLCLSSAFALATLAMRFFDSTSSFKGHLAFGQLLSPSFQCVYYNRSIGRSINRCEALLKKECLFCLHFIALYLFPVAIARGIVHRYIEPISWTRAIKRAGYFICFTWGLFYAAQTAK